MILRLKNWPLVFRYNEPWKKSVFCLVSAGGAMRRGFVITITALYHNPGVWLEDWLNFCLFTWDFIMCFYYPLYFGEWWNPKWNPYPLGSWCRLYYVEWTKSEAPRFVPGMVKLSGQSPFIRDHRARYPGRHLITPYVKVSWDTDTKDVAGFCVQWLATGKDTFS